MRSRNIVTEKADLILDLGVAGYPVTVETCRLTLVKLRLLHLRFTNPGLFAKEASR